MDPRLGAIVVALAGTGCAARSTVLIADPSLSPDELDDFRRAAAEWCRAADAPWACLSAVPGAFEQPSWRDFGERLQLVRASTSTPVFAGAMREFGPFISGLHRNGAIALFPHALTSRHDWVQTSLHEIGHHLGLDHGDGDAMVPGAETTCVDSRSLLSLCSRRSCGPAAAPTCPESM